MKKPDEIDAALVLDDEAAFAHLKEVIGEWLVYKQLEGQQPMVPAANLFQAIYQVLVEHIPVTAARMGMLMALETSYAQGLTADDRNALVAMMAQVSAARAKVEGRGGLILPGRHDA